MEASYFKEMNDLQISIVRNEFYSHAKRCISNKLFNHRGEKVIVSKSNLDEIFGLAYVSSGMHAIITLDTNEHVKVGDFHYSYLAVNNKGVYVVLLDSEENEKHIQISYVNIQYFNS